MSEVYCWLAPEKIKMSKKKKKLTLDIIIHLVVIIPHNMCHKLVVYRILASFHIHSVIHAFSACWASQNATRTPCPGDKTTSAFSIGLSPSSSNMWLSRRSKR
jgi:hypothetical protein